MIKREDINIDEIKAKLESELLVLTNELKTIGRINPDNPADWEPLPADNGVIPADRNESADNIEDFEANTAILKELEIRFNAVKDALKAIEDGTYGYCKECNEPIEKERLEANPSARTCLAHA